MPEPAYVNLDTVATVAQALGDLNEEVIYVGGAIISLYVDDPSAWQKEPQGATQPDALANRNITSRGDL